MKDYKVSEATEGEKAFAWFGIGLVTGLMIMAIIMTLTVIK